MGLFAGPYHFLEVMPQFFHVTFLRFCAVGEELGGVTEFFHH